jgi:D-xylonolactonase
MEILKQGLGFLEAPVWDNELGLLFADASRGGVYRLDKDRNLTILIKHRRGIGGAVRHVQGGLVVSGRNIAYKSFQETDTVVVMSNDPDNGIVGFNDITTDRMGRIYAGALGFVPSHTSGFLDGSHGKRAALWLIDLDGSVRSVHPDILLSNGLGFSPDGSVLYHTDSGERRMYVYDVNLDGGLTNRRLFTSAALGLPDGLAISDDGVVWSADAIGGRVLRFSPEGDLLDEIQFPVPMITSLCFGGSDMKDVYVVSGQPPGAPEDGSIFRLRSPVPGKQVFPARISPRAGSPLP